MSCCASSVAQIETNVAGDDEDRSRLLVTAQVQFVRGHLDPAPTTLTEQALSGQWQQWQGPILFASHHYQYSGAVVRYSLGPRDALGADPAILLWRYSMNARVFVNGKLASAPGKLDPPTRNLHRPQLVRLILADLHTDENVVDIELAVVPGFGYLLPPVLGGFETLRSQYDQRYFNQITLNQIIFGLTLLFVVLGFALWGFDVSNRSYLYFALGAFCWSFFSLNPFVGDLPFPTTVWLWLLHTSLDLFVLFITLFVHSFFGLRRRKIELLVTAYVFLASCTYTFLPLETFAQTSTMVHLGTFACLLYAVCTTAWLALRRNRYDAYAFTACFVIIFLLGVHDALLTSGSFEVLWQNSFFALNLGVPILLLAIAAQLMWQLRSANLHTERSLALATLELEESYERRRVLEKGQAANEERARIYRDLHDDVGAKLLDLVYLAEPEHANIARGALEDIRSIATVTNHESLALVDWLRQMKIESESRLAEHAIALTWQGMPSGYSLTGKQQYHLTRVLRELVTNAIKHSGGNQVNVMVRIQDADSQNLAIVVSDNGRGGKDEIKAGNGLNSLRRRITDLEGTAEVEAQDGFAVHLSIPLVIAD